MKRLMSSGNERKRVRISEEKPDVHLQQNDALSEKERSESWWTQSEYAEAKDSVKQLCREHRKARRYSDCLSDAYKTACVMASSGEEETSHQQQHTAPSDALPDAEALPPPDKGLLRWVEDQGPRGLEGYSSRLHAMRRQRHLQDTKHAVFLEQARQSISNERDHEQLARQAEIASRRARTFASLLGHADAWAARSTENQDKPSAQKEADGDRQRAVSVDSESSNS